MTRNLRILVATLAALLLTLPARAENPKVTLQVENATAAEAAAALARASGVRLEVVPPRLPDGVPVPPAVQRLSDRASFDWRQTTLAGALRQLCERYDLLPGRAASGYRLTLRSDLAAPPAPGCLFEKNGTLLFVRQVTTVQRGHHVVIINGQPPIVFDQRVFSMAVGCLALEGGAERIAGLANLVAIDDQGSDLEASAEPTDSGNLWAKGGGAEEWLGSIRLAGLSPGAQKLAVLEGDVMAYQVYRHHRLEFPLPLTPDGARREAGKATLKVTAFAVDGAASPGPTVQAEIFLPRDANVQADPRTGVAPVLVGASGKIFAPLISRANGSGDARGMLYVINSEFRRVDEPLAKIAFTLVERSQPARLLSFRLRDIPLPPAPIRARLPALRPEEPASPALTWPYFQSGGGTLVSPVEPAASPPVGAVLALGLARREGGAWSSIRWVDLAVGRDGIARLPDLKPGTYRVLRDYRLPQADQAPARPLPGRWLNAETTVEVAAGPETRLPSLRWVAATRSKP